MRVFITGATGFIGRALVPILNRSGHQVMAWARSPERARNLLGADVEIVAATAGGGILRGSLERCDAVVNLAGESIMGGRWTEARRRVLTESRVSLTRQLVQAIAEAGPRPRILISGSAVGYYGDRGTEVLNEVSTGGRGFLAHLCHAWEAEAQAAADKDKGIRVVILRTGVVLGRGGGALEQMLPPFRLGAGGPVGSGRQYMPWIHLHDVVHMIAAALVDDRYHGPINLVAPEEATSLQFAKALGRALHRPAVLPLPAGALRLIFGEAAGVLLGSQRVVSPRLREIGFACQFPDLDRALADILVNGDVQITPFRSSRENDERGGGGYLRQRRPRYELRARTVLDCPVEQAFPFFSKAENLGLITPAAMRFQIDGTAPALALGATIDYRLRVGPIPIQWRTRIEDWEPQHRFVDVQESGPYRGWWHEHTFYAEGDRTVMEDRVLYAPPLGLLGRLANRMFVVPTLRKIFGYRGDVIRLRFGRTGGVRGRSAWCREIQK
ncbi:MAG: TIGR01777 family oxidoreductase [Terriglobales bacterium]|jgi:uncharacterized protein (TIGR01777 family)